MTSLLARAAGAAGVTGGSLLAYAGLVERNAFVVRHVTVPVLAAGEAPLRVLHVSDLHVVPRQRRKLNWVRSLATLSPDLVVVTGDFLSDAAAPAALLTAFEPLFAFPGAFVPGNNDYWSPRPKNPLGYLSPLHEQPRTGKRLPWEQFAADLVTAGWTDLTHVRTSLSVGAGRRAVALTGTDDPHLRRAKYELVAGAADPDAVVRIGVTHSPEPFVLADFAADGYDLVLAGHTHGGQVRVPFGPAIVTNCGLDVWRARGLSTFDGMWLHVSAGAGASPYTAIRFACQPEATLLTLVPR